MFIPKRNSPLPRCCRLFLSLLCCQGNSTSERSQQFAPNGECDSDSNQDSEEEGEEEEEEEEEKEDEVIVSR